MRRCQAGYRRRRVQRGSLLSKSSPCHLLPVATCCITSMQHGIPCSTFTSGPLVATFVGCPTLSTSTPLQDLSWLGSFTAARLWSIDLDLTMFIYNCRMFHAFVHATRTLSTLGAAMSNCCYSRENSFTSRRSSERECVFSAGSGSMQSVVWTLSNL